MKRRFWILVGFAVISCVTSLLMVCTVLKYKPKENIFELVRGTEVTNITLDFETKFKKDILGQFDGLIPYWEDSQVRVRKVASDLVVVCIDKSGTTPTCEYVEYWTDSREERRWTMLERFEPDDPGPYCKELEEWKVAKGMPCRRLGPSSVEVPDSIVNF